MTDRFKTQNTSFEHSIFWAKVERIFGSIPRLICKILEYNGFDSYLALKGIQEDKNIFFQVLEESIASLAELKDEDPLKVSFRNELLANSQNIENFKLKLGHKNLILNLVNELQNTNLDEFNNASEVQTLSRQMPEVIVVKRKLTEDEHGYCQEDEKLKIKHAKHEYATTDQYCQEDEITETCDQPQIQYIYEEDDEDGEYVNDDGAAVEYHEVIEEDLECDTLFSAEQVLKQETDTYEQVDDDQLNIVAVKNSKKPKHMYAEEFLQAQNTTGRIGTPGRRRPKIQKSYSSMEERWIDLVRQSCEVIVPQALLSKYQHALANIEVYKLLPHIWEVSCPLCIKKIRLQLTHEGKYLNFKRSNFERHLRIVHYKEILKFKPTLGNDRYQEDEDVPLN